MRQKQALPIKSFYYISGDEMYLKQQARDDIKALFRERGFDTIETTIADGQFDRDAFRQSYQSADLFAPKKILLLVILDKISETIRKAMQEFVSQQPADTILIVDSPKLTKASRQAKWFKTLLADGHHLSIWPLSPHEAPQWLIKQAQARGVTLTPEGAHFLHAHSEGHLHSSIQELDKIALSGEEQPITTDYLSSCIRQSSQFTVFDLISAWLLDNPQKACTIFDTLLANKVEPSAILWALCHTLRQLHALIQLQDYHHQVQYCKRQGIWDAKMRELMQGASRYDAHYIEAMLLTAANIDGQIKGLQRHHCSISERLKNFCTNP